jgi:membrane associated rhomboid family serine protease
MLPIPIGDVTRARIFPVVNIILIIINVLVFLYEISLGPRGFQLFTLAYGTIPLEIMTGRDLPPAGPTPIYLTLLTSMFMHGSWTHLIGNMLFLWVFGDNVEDAMGHLKYLIFYLICGILASFTHIFFNLGSTIPAVGASGAIFGTLGAYFVLHPQGQIRTLFIFFIIIRILYLPAWLLLGAYFIFQFFESGNSGVAVWAHIGGFVAGAVLIFLFRDRDRLMLGRLSQSPW